MTNKPAETEISPEDLDRALRNAARDRAYSARRAKAIVAAREASRRKWLALAKANEADPPSVPPPVRKPRRAVAEA